MKKHKKSKKFNKKQELPNLAKEKKREKKLKTGRKDKNQQKV